MIKMIDEEGMHGTLALEVEGNHNVRSREKTSTENNGERSDEDRITGTPMISNDTDSLFSEESNEVQRSSSPEEKSAEGSRSASKYNVLVEFFRGNIAGPPKLTIHECLHMSDTQLEARHDYIQWIFPSPRPSDFNSRAPVFDATTAELFRNDSRLTDTLKECLLRMLQFYSMEFKHTTTHTGESSSSSNTIVLSSAFRSKKKNKKGLILCSHSKFHNFLRLTRILLSLKTAGLVSEALALHRVLVEDLPQHTDVPDTTIRFWNDAVKDILSRVEEDSDEREKKESDEGGENEEK